VGSEYTGVSASSAFVTLCRKDEPSVGGRCPLSPRAGASAANMSDDKRPVCTERLKPTSLARMLISREYSSAAAARS